MEKEHVKEQTPGMASSRQPQTERTSYHFPKVSVFYRESGKGEVYWEAWKYIQMYEVVTLINSRSFTDEPILIAIRRSLKGDVGDRVREFGHGASLDYVLNQLKADYGSLKLRKSIMRQFFSRPTGIR